MSKSKKYWKGLEELENNSSFVDSSQKEFSEYLPVNEFLATADKQGSEGTSRRDFLKYLGFGISAASLAACKTPVTKAIPYIVKPEEITPGEANYYASTYFDGNDYCPILVKTREGRPIFIKGNKESTLTKGNINARVNASVVSLYDGQRYKSPKVSGKDTSWKSIDNEIRQNIQQAKDNGKEIHLVTCSLISPSLMSIIDKFKSYEGFSHIIYDDISYSAMIAANKKTFNIEAIPTYHFDKAKTIVSIGADFLSGWTNSIVNEVGYSTNKNPDNSWMVEHFQFEANYSISGAKAEHRTPVKPSEYSLVLRSLYNHVATLLGKETIGTVKTKYEKEIKQAAESLVASKEKSMVLFGSNDKDSQVVVNYINALLGSYGTTIDLDNYSKVKQDNGTGLEKMIAAANSKNLEVLMVYGVDLFRTSPKKYNVAAAIKKVKHTVSFATKEDETSSAFKYICPDNHSLESWGDFQPNRYDFSLAQPTISKLFDTRQFGESLLTWLGEETTMLDYIKGYWQANLFQLSADEVVFSSFWNTVLHDGTFSIKHKKDDLVLNSDDLEMHFNAKAALKGTGGVEVVFYQKEAIGNGNGSDNPFLQELPDPISKVTWDNYVTMNPADMREGNYNMHIAQKDPASLVKLTINDVVIDKIPVIAQPGQKRGTIAIALGYGKKVGKMKLPTGQNVFPCMSESAKGHITNLAKAKIDALNETYPMARTQTHHTVMGRGSIIKEVDLAVYKKGDRNLYNKPHTLPFHENGKTVDKPIKEIDLWAAHPVEEVGHRWGMSVDLNSCTGCGACITACNIENNVPVVGKDEVRRGREMHWLRIDRYYSSDMTKDKAKEEGVGTISMYRKMENPSDENPKVVHQPMMCQHCNHAGCETVCPVAATSHSNEGLNMMTYNRCIGTRYCANNCAYKVRRFNWFNYGSDKFKEVNLAYDDLGRFVLNPDVVVRARGVMEKCSLCVQKIQAGKLVAKKEGRAVKDGEIQTACSEACGSGAIVFGDLNDKGSDVNKAMNADRAYRVIEEVGQQPNVYYQTKVNNIST